jgi:dienelactone hydrolase
LSVGANAHHPGAPATCRHRREAPDYEPAGSRRSQKRSCRTRGFSVVAAAGVDWRMTVYGGIGHSFTNPEIDKLGWDGFAYDAAADARSHRAMLDLLQETIGLP